MERLCLSVDILSMLWTMDHHYKMFLRGNWVKSTRDLSVWDTAFPCQCVSVIFLEKSNSTDMQEACTSLLLGLLLFIHLTLRASICPLGWFPSQRELCFYLLGNERVYGDQQNLICLWSPITGLSGSSELPYRYAQVKPTDQGLGNAVCGSVLSL